jgi:hypothetical protein
LTPRGPVHHFFREISMKIKTTVQTDKYANVSWPDGVPLPAIGDSVVLVHAGETIEFVVDRRSFDMGTDTQSAAPMAKITIHGHHSTPGSV